LKVDKIFIDDEINSKLKEEIQPVYTKQTSGLPPPPLRQSTIIATPSVGSENQRPSSQLVADAPLSIPPTPKLDRADSQKPQTQTAPEAQQASQLTEQQSQEKTLAGKTTSMQSLSQPKQNIFVWNGVITIDNPNQTGKKITIDRKSWISRIDEQTSQMIPVHYALDKIGYPR
jgi:hypothetical protein